MDSFTSLRRDIQALNRYVRSKTVTKYSWAVGYSEGNGTDGYVDRQDAVGKRTGQLGDSEGSDVPAGCGDPMLAG